MWVEYYGGKESENGLYLFGNKIRWPDVTWLDKGTSSHRIILLSEMQVKVTQKMMLTFI